MDIVRIVLTAVTYVLFLRWFFSVLPVLTIQSITGWEMLFKFTWKKLLQGMRSPLAIFTSGSRRGLVGWSVVKNVSPAIAEFTRKRCFLT